jgi:phosphate transport system substrate-binding protein
VVLVLVALAAGGLAAALAVWPELLSLVSGGIVGRVSISPQEAALAGGQWRVVSQWQAAGEMNEAENIYLVEFKAVPGWDAPAPVVVKKGGPLGSVEGVYVPVRYSEQTILTCAGAGALAGRLIPELARNYLLHIGADEVKVVPGAGADEFSVQGIFFDTREIRKIDIHGRGTPYGFTALKDGECDVALASHRLSSVDARTMGANVISGESERRLGMDAVSVVVHRDNPVPDLTVEQVGRIFAGEVTNWDQVGGPSARINVYALKDTFATRGFFESVFLGSRDILADAREVDVQSQLPEFVARDPWGIGFCSITQAGPCREVPIRAAAGSEALLPTTETIRSLAYPASRSMYLYVRSDSHNVHAQDFVEMSLSVAGQELVGKFGFVPLGKLEGAAAAETHVSSLQGGENVPSIFRPGAPSVLKAPAITGDLPRLVQLDGEVVPNETRKAVLQEYLDGVYGGERLPIVFRFQSSSLDPDGQALQDVGRVANLMKERANASKAVILVGFSDSVGDYASNLAVSVKRAEVIAERLRARGLDNITVLGAGEEEAVEPNESRVGRDRNRRVEIWLK